MQCGFFGCRKLDLERSVSSVFIPRCGERERDLKSRVCVLFFLFFLLGVGCGEEKRNGRRLVR